MFIDKHWKTTPNYKTNDYKLKFDSNKPHSTNLTGFRSKFETFTVTQNDREADRCSNTYTHLPHTYSVSPPPTPQRFYSWTIFDKSWTCWSRNPRSRIAGPEQHLCTVRQASCVIYDLAMRQQSGQLDKGYIWKMRFSWLLMPQGGWRFRCCSCQWLIWGRISKEGFFFFLSTLSEVTSDVCGRLMISPCFKNLSDFLLIYIEENQIFEFI